MAGFQEGGLHLKKKASISSAVAGWLRLYAKNDGKVYQKDESGNDYQVLTKNDGAAYGNFGVVFDGAGTVLAANSKADIRMPYAGQIISVTLLADVSGSLVIDIWKDTYANFPPTVANTITAAAKPTLSAASKYEDTTLTGWTTSFALGDVFRFNIDSVATITRATLTLRVLKS